MGPDGEGIAALVEKMFGRSADLASDRPDEKGSGDRQCRRGCRRRRRREAQACRQEDQDQSGDEDRTAVAGDHGAGDRDAGEGEGEQNAAGRPVGFRIVVCGVPVGGGDQEEGGKPGLDDEMHHRRQGIGSVEDEDEEGPGQDAGRGRKGEPAPQAKARDPIGGQDHEDEIDHQRPGLRFVRGDEERASHGAEQAERGEDRAMQRRRNHGEDRDEAEQDEGRRRADQIVERVRCIGRGEGAAGSGCGEDRGHVRLGKPRQDDILLAPAQPFAGADQGEGEEAAQARCGSRG